MPNEALTAIVRQARCMRCDGQGFKMAPAEDTLGERIGAKPNKVECEACQGNGIKLAVCRRLQAEINRASMK